MTKKEIQALIDRWASPEFAEHRAVMAAITAGEEALEATTLRTEDGRFDFRGVTFPSPYTEPWGVLGDLLIETPKRSIEWENITLSRFDFTAATITHWRCTNTELNDCIFDHANCYGMKLSRSDIVNCSFRHADLRNSTLGVMHYDTPITLTDVDFTRADLRDAYFFDSDLRNITFDNAKLDRADFSGSAFDDVTFAGRLKKVFFVGKPPHDPDQHHDYWMHNVDLSKTTWDDSLLENYDLDTVQLPDHVTAIHNTRDTLARAADYIEAHLADQPEADRTMRILRNTGGGPKWTTGTYAVDLDAFSPPVAHLIRTALQAITT